MDKKGIRKLLGFSIAMFVLMLIAILSIVALNDLSPHFWTATMVAMSFFFAGNSAEHWTDMKKSANSKSEKT